MKSAPPIVTIMSVLLATLSLMASRLPAEEATPRWKTAFYKRGFAGETRPGEREGTSTVRVPMPLFFSGSMARVWVRSQRETAIVLEKLSLAKGRDRAGTIEGGGSPVTFTGTGAISLPPKAPDTVSDETNVPITKGVWYLQQTYSDPKVLYAYDPDGTYAESGDAHNAPKLSYDRDGAYVGNAFRVDVWTTDERGVIACYGDSITAGAKSTGGTGNRYPELLAGLLDQPTLNLGVNGDFARHSGGMPNLIDGLDGVTTVIYLMGINDIVKGLLTDPGDYIQKVSEIIAGVQKSGRKIYLGTIPPASGWKQFDEAPAKEELRQQVNQWIRTEAPANGVVDFDAALRDPKTPTKLREDLQADWLHPNDAGYQVMAAAAATALSPTATKQSPEKRK